VEYKRFYSIIMKDWLSFSNDRQTMTF